MEDSLNIIDLTYEIDPGMLTFTAPWHPKVTIKQLGEIGKEGRETREITMGTHTGTHMDAPRHFVRDGKTIDTITLDRVQGKVTIVDFSSFNDNECVTKEMLKKIQITSKMIFKFGWGKHWGNKKYFDGWPYFTKEAAQYLIDSGVKLVAMDTPSPDCSSIPFGVVCDSQIHKLFLENEIIIIEYLANLDKVTEYDGWRIVALPLKIKGADGSPIRVFIHKNKEE